MVTTLPCIRTRSAGSTAVPQAPSAREHASSADPIAIGLPALRFMLISFLLTISSSRVMKNPIVTKQRESVDPHLAWMTDPDTMV